MQKHMAAMSQKRWNKIDKQKTVIANQTQLNQSSTQLHGPGHLKAANAGIALPSLEHVDLDDFGRMLDSGGHLRRAIGSLKRAVAEKKSARKD